MDGSPGQLRKPVGLRRLFVPSVQAMIQKNEKELLLQHTDDLGLWDLPGGAVEIGEAALEVTEA